MSHVPAAGGPRVLPGPQIREAGEGGLSCVRSGVDDLGFAWTRAAAQMRGETDQSGGEKERRPGLRERAKGGEESKGRAKRCCQALPLDWWRASMTAKTSYFTI